MTQHAVCACRTCGYGFVCELKETGKNASKRLAAKVRWAEAGGISECPSCREIRLRREAEKVNLFCTVLLPYWNRRQDFVYGVFSGVTDGREQDLRDIGCKLSNQYPASRNVSPCKAWMLVSRDIRSLVEKARSIGAVITMPPQNEVARWQSARNEARSNRCDGEIDGQLLINGFPTIAERST